MALKASLAIFALVLWIDRWSVLISLRQAPNLAILVANYVFANTSSNVADILRYSKTPVKSFFNFIFTFIINDLWPFDFENRSQRKLSVFVGW